MIGRRILLVAMAVAMLIHASCAKQAGPTPPIGSDYGTVTKDQLSGEQTCSATGTSGAKFMWVFSGDRFEIKGDGRPLPQGQHDHRHNALPPQGDDRLSSGGEPRRRMW